MSRLNKQSLVDAVIEQISGVSRSLEVAGRYERQGSIEATGALEAGGISGKVEHGHLAIGLDERYFHNEEGILALRDFTLPEAPDTVMEGALVELEEARRRLYFFVLPYGAGTEIRAGRVDVSRLIYEESVIIE